MIQLLAGAKGTGKTKRLLNMANQSVKTTDGTIVYIDDDKRHIYDLHYDIRFVGTEGYPLSDCRVFTGFICGILSQNSDIEKIYIDGLTNIIGFVDGEGLIKLHDELDTISKGNNVSFVISVNWDEDKLPENIREFVI